MALDEDCPGVAGGTAAGPRSGGERDLLSAALDRSRETRSEDCYWLYLSSNVAGGALGV